MKRTTLLAALLLFTLTLFSCEEELTVCPVETEPKEALLRFTGSPALDGCGWLIEVSSKTYSPTNLPTEFQKEEEQRVLITYELLNEKFSCGFGNTQFNKIRITRITPA